MKSAAILVLSLAAQLFVLGEDQSPSLPGWLSNFPQTTALSETRLPDSVRVFYETIAPMAAVITHYQEQLRKAQIASTTTDYGTGKTISARTTGVSCDARVIAVDGGSRVWVVCTPGNDGKQPAPASKGKESCIARIFGDDGGPREIVANCQPEEPKGASLPPIGFRPADPSADQHQVEYSIAGSASEVGVTARNATGGTEQYEASVPYRSTLYVGGGAFVYLSAQNKVRTGPSVSLFEWTGRCSRRRPRPAPTVSRAPAEESRSSQVGVRNGAAEDRHRGAYS